MTSEGVVLIVDDSRAIRSWLSRQLTARSFTVVEADNGAAAVRQARAARPDIVLLDVDMPEMDGHQALAVMRADPALEGLPVIFLTGRAGTDDVVEGLQLGAQDYLRKPCEPAELIARVRTVLRMKARQDELHRRNDELSAETSTDELTGLPNRRALGRLLPQLVERARSRGERVGVLVVDIDHFKQVNDSYGHLIGDVVLRTVARRLRSGLRQEQVVGRWGGEEFLVLAADSSLDDAARVAERLRATVGFDPVPADNGQHVSVTVSIGVAAGSGDATDLLRHADAALYVAKAQGRNRVVTAPSP